MFTNQSAQISTALHQGGIDAALARTVESLLGQCRATIDHRGPINFEYTPPRTITPALAQHSLPDLRPFEPLNLPRKKKKTPAPPQRKDFVPPEHKRNDQGNPEPGEPDGPDGERVNDSLDYDEGDYIRIDNQRRVVSLRADDAPGRRHCVWPGTRNRGNHIHAVKFTSTSSNDAHGKIQVQERLTETNFRLTLNVEQIQVVTGVELDTTISPPELRFNMSTCYVFEPEEISDQILTLAECAAPETPP